jgi:hypothetical protein
LTHALAIERAMREGYAIYDFMAGENRLKASFASHWRDTLWLSVQRASAALWLEGQVAAAKHRLAQARFAAAPAQAVTERRDVRA